MPPTHDEARFPGICRLCDEPVSGEEILNHLRLIHPDVYGAGPPRWPDGSPAIAVIPAGVPDDEPENITLELHIRLNGQSWTAVADDIIEAARQLGVTVTGSKLFRDLTDQGE